MSEFSITRLRHFADARDAARVKLDLATKRLKEAKQDLSRAESVTRDYRVNTVAIQGRDDSETERLAQTHQENLDRHERDAADARERVSLALRSRASLEEEMRVAASLAHSCVEFARTKQFCPFDIAARA